ncbi:UNVERIFIED_CONTAM: hypothetical protein NY603_15285 [Bacteroidetes bacterium 56_B9]
MSDKPYRQYSTFFDLSKKARPPPGTLLPLDMNCQIILILLTIPLRLSASCRQAHFAFSGGFFKKISLSFGV